VFCLLDFLTPDDGTDRFSWKVGKKFTTQCCIMSHISADLTQWFSTAGLGLILHGPVQSDLVWRGLIQRFICKFKTTRTYLRAEFRDKTLSYSRVNMVICYVEERVYVRGGQFEQFLSHF
jgi:hypothetical protein